MSEIKQKGREMASEAMKRPIRIGLDDMREYYLTVINTLVAARPVEEAISGRYVDIMLEYCTAVGNGRDISDNEYMMGLLSGSGVKIANHQVFRNYKSGLNRKGWITISRGVTKLDSMLEVAVKTKMMCMVVVNVGDVK